MAVEADSHFKDCPRDERGWCEPGDGGGSSIKRSESDAPAKLATATDIARASKAQALAADNFATSVVSTFDEQFRDEVKAYVKDARAWFGSCSDGRWSPEEVRECGAAESVKLRTQAFVDALVRRYVATTVAGKRQAYMRGYAAGEVGREHIGAEPQYGGAPVGVTTVHGRRVEVAVPLRLREKDSYFADCPRNEKGWCEPSGGSGVAIKSVNDRVFAGQTVQTTTVISKQAVGALGEKLAVAWMQRAGIRDARPLNLDRNNFPIDLIQDHEVIEVKAGLASNGSSAQQWRLTIGEPGVKEKAWLAKATPRAKERWNAKKQERIRERKDAVLKAVSKQLGRKVKPKTMTFILNPDRKQADVYMFDGWHDRIGWNSDAARKGYVGTIEYRD